jgi:hypothetical protein
MSRTLEPAYGRQPNGKLPHGHPRSRSWAGTGLATTHDTGEIRQDDHQLHGVVHHTVICSLELCGTIVNRLPLAYKWRGRSPGHGGREGIAAHLHVSALTTILALRLNQTSGTWRPLLLSRIACSPLCKRYRATRYSASSAPLLDVRPTAGTRIKLMSCCLAPVIER